MNGGPSPLLRPGQVVTGGSGGAECSLFWALVYVPQGTTAGHSTSQQQVVTGGSGGAESNLFWALVYVPQGTTAGALNVATAGATPSSMYEPNQFVMNCGVIDLQQVPIRIYSPISRNLNDGDRSLSSSVLLLMGRLQLSLSVCAMLSLSIK